MQFEAFPKIPRLKRNMIVTEKIDGTNAQIHIVHTEGLPAEELAKNGAIVVGEYLLRPGSRSRYLTHEQDNFGFWAWCYAHREWLVNLGPGRHFGEWWGKGIQRGYGLDHKRFSLFNTARWGEHNPPPSCCHVVPVLYAGNFDDVLIQDVINALKTDGSVVSYGFKPAEGVVVYLPAANSMFKVLCENDDKPKGLVEAA